MKVSGKSLRNGVKTEVQKDVNRIFVEDGHLIDEALQQGVRDAMLRHKEAGLPVVIYRDGKTVWVMPQDLGF
jgi:hypothetical protein